MKTSLITLLFAAASLSTHVAQANESLKHNGYYVCTAKGNKLRQWNSNYPADATIWFVEKVDGTSGLRTFENVGGHIYVDYDFNQSDSSAALNYRGVFAIESVTENAAYKPVKYKGYSQIQKFNAAVTGPHDGGGMFGYLVIAPSSKTEKFAAHYVFQSGDHMGGTVDFECQKD